MKETIIAALIKSLIFWLRNLKTILSEKIKTIASAKLRQTTINKKRRKVTEGRRKDGPASACANFAKNNRNSAKKDEKTDLAESFIGSINQELA